MIRRSIAVIVIGLALLALAQPVSSKPANFCNGRPTHPHCQPTPMPSPSVSATPTPTTTPVPTATPTIPTPTPSTQFVTRNGTDLSLNGTRYRFTGMNSYNLNSRSGLPGCSYNASPGAANELFAKDGMEAHRAWFFQRFIWTGSTFDWTAFDHTLNQARAEGRRMIVTLTDHWGACDYMAGPRSESWYVTGYKDLRNGFPLTYRQWVQEVVSRYRDHTGVLMWQMVNEAESRTSTGSCSAGSVLRDFADDIGGLIRSIDPNHLISLGTLGGSQCGIDGTKYRDIHASPFIDICEFHHYEGSTVYPAILAQRISECNGLNKPIFIGEIGRPGSQFSSQQARADFFAAVTDRFFLEGGDGLQEWNYHASFGGCNPLDYDICHNDPAVAAMQVR